MIKLPKYPLQQVEDFWAYYTIIIGIPDDLFWTANPYNLRKMAKNKAAYSNWLSYAQERYREHGKK